MNSRTAAAHGCKCRYSSVHRTATEAEDKGHGDCVANLNPCETALLTLPRWPSSTRERSKVEGSKQRIELFLCSDQDPSSHPGEEGDWGGGALPSFVGTMLVRVTSSGLRPPFSFRLIALCVSKDHSCGEILFRVWPDCSCGNNSYPDHLYFISTFSSNLGPPH